MTEFVAIMSALAQHPDAALVAYVIYQVHKLDRKVGGFESRLTSVEQKVATFIKR